RQGYRSLEMRTSGTHRTETCLPARSRAEDQAAQEYDFPPSSVSRTWVVDKWEKDPIWPTHASEGGIRGRVHPGLRLDAALEALPAGPDFLASGAMDADDGVRPVAPGSGHGLLLGLAERPCATAEITANPIAALYAHSEPSSPANSGMSEHSRRR